MKKSLLVSAVVAAAFVMASCVTTVDKTTAKQGWSNYTDISAKDFNSLGIIFVESEITETIGVFGFTHDTTGSSVTYKALMEEAQKLGADDVINVRIDQQRLGKKTIFTKIFGGTITTKYMGTGLAVKYKDATPNTEKSAAKTLALPDEDAESTGGIITNLKNKLF